MTRPPDLAAFDALLARRDLSPGAKLVAIVVAFACGERMDAAGVAARCGLPVDETARHLTDLAHGGHLLVERDAVPS